MHRFLTLLILLAAPAITHAADPPEKFIADYVAKLKPLELQNNLGWWDASVTGKDEDFQPEN